MYRGFCNDRGDCSERARKDLVGPLKIEGTVLRYLRYMRIENVPKGVLPLHCSDEVSLDRRLSVNLYGTFADRVHHEVP